MVEFGAFKHIKQVFSKNCLMRQTVLFSYPYTRDTIASKFNISVKNYDNIINIPEPSKTKRINLW